MFISGAVCAAGGLLAVLTIRNPRPHPGRRPRRQQQEPTWYCGVSAPPLNPSLAATVERPALTPTCGRRGRRQR